MAIVAAMRAKPSFRSFTLGGSSGMVVGSGSLDGPRVHRSADSAWIEPSVDGHVKPTGAEMVRTGCRAPGRPWPGRRTGVPCRGRRTGANTPSQSEGEHLADGQSPTVRGSQRTTNHTRLSGNPVRVERAERRLTPRVRARAMQSASEVLVDSHTHRIVQVGEWRTTACMEECSMSWSELCASSDGIFSRRLNTSSVEGGLFSGQACTTNTFVAGRNVRDWVSPQVSLMYYVLL